MSSGAGYEISIHAPARGATPTLKICLVKLQFQSTLPRGERRNVGTTIFGIMLFQSTLPRGERPHHVQTRPYIRRFQSTLPRGERRSLSCSPQSHRYFNPRSREGSDSNFYPKSYLIFSKNCLKLLKSLYVSILQNIFKHSMTYFQVRIPQSIYVSLAFAPNL